MHDYVEANCVEVKPIPIVACFPHWTSFTCACFKFIVLFASVVIDQSGYFGCSFTTLTQLKTALSS